MFKKIQADLQNKAKLCTGFCEATYRAWMANKHLPSIPQPVSKFWFPLLFYLSLVSVILYYYILLILIQM